MSVRDILKKTVLFFRSMRRTLQLVFNRLQFAVKGVTLKGSPREINGIVCVRRSRAGSIEIGEGAKINSGGRYNIIAPDLKTRCVLRTIGSGRIVIGRNAAVSNAAIVAAEAVTVGDNVMIGGGVRIWDTDFHPLAYAERAVSDEAPGKSAPVVIRDGAFIGADSIILKGADIGERAVIGAGSVVRGKVGADEVRSGNPAVKIR